MNLVTTRKRTILIVEARRLLAELLARLLTEKLPEVEVSIAHSSAAANELLDRQPQDLALVGMQMTGCSGITRLVEVKARSPRTRCLMLGDDANAAWVERAVKSGADGFVTKYCDAQEVVDAVRSILEGRRHFSQDVMNSVAAHRVFGSDEQPHRQLSAREFEVFVQLGEGKSLKGISHDLHLTPGTVSVHKHNIWKKTGLDSAARIARYCMEHGLVKGAA